MGVDVQGMAFSSASTQNPHYDNTTFYVYKIVNKSGQTIEGVYFGAYTDVDLGNWADDHIGSDSLLSLSYAYNADNNDEGDFGYGLNPPAFGVQNTRDPTVNGHPMGMMPFIFAADPWTAQQFNNNLQGLSENGTPITVGGFGGCFSDDVTTFMFSGDPVIRSFWTELNIAGEARQISAETAAP